MSRAAGSTPTQPAWLRDVSFIVGLLLFLVSGGIGAHLVYQDMGNVYAVVIWSLMLVGGSLLCWRNA